MFTEKNLPRLIVATPIVFVLLFALFIIYFFVNTQYSNFQEESLEIEKEYFLRQKNILKNENRRIIEYINFHRGVEKKRIHNKFRKLIKNGFSVTEEVVENYEKESIQKLKLQIINWIEQVRYEQNGYVWVHNTAHHLVAHPFRRYSIGIDDTNNTDSTGTKIFQKFIEVATAHKDGGFVEYFWAKPEFGAPRKKIGFLYLDSEWGWVVGTGLYADDIESSLQKKKLALEQKIDKYVRIILLTALSLMILLGVVSFIISQNIVSVFTSYSQKVSKKEQALKEFNKMLSSKVKEALKVAKQKDQALLHQSRLAQMGEMISMIAHQWRQPLSAISGIFMEMETAAKFDKADRVFVQSEAKKGDKIVSYMSKTIDDFRDFFKPSKTQEMFSLKCACEEAMSLASASLSSKDINLELHVKSDIQVIGHVSEFAQVILNLILNAKDVLIQRDITNPQILIKIDAKDNRVHVSISDNAGGVEKNIKEKIFEPYFSTKNTAGTGLGLYMSKMIIEEKMGGKLFVENSEKGAMFCIKI